MELSHIGCHRFCSLLMTTRVVERPVRVSMREAGQYEWCCSGRGLAAYYEYYALCRRRAAAAARLPAISPRPPVFNFIHQVADLPKNCLKVHRSLKNYFLPHILTTHIGKDDQRQFPKQEWKFCGTGCHVGAKSLDKSKYGKFSIAF